MLTGRATGESRHFPVNHNMGNHNNAHKALNREVAMNTRSNHGGFGHFGGRR